MLLRRRRRRLVRCIMVPVLFFGVASGLFGLVEAGPRVGIRREASQYMLDTGPKQFSKHGLEQILHGERIGPFNPTTLWFIYWAYFGFISACGAFLLLSPIFFWRLIKTDWQGGLLTVGRLQRALSRFVDSPSLASKTRLLAAVATTPELYGAISPLKRRWFRRPEYQWFKSGDLDCEARSVVQTASRLELGLLKAVLSGRDLRQFQRAIDLLSDFFFAIACRQDKNLRQSGAEVRHADQERSLLIEFARTARPAILDAGRPERKGKKRSALIALLSAAARSPVMRSALVVSSVAAGVMVFGVLLFKIQRSQAFLTWFTVSFGSVTISVGVEAFKLRRPKDEGNIDPESEE